MNSYPAVLAMSVAMLAVVACTGTGTGGGGGEKITFTNTDTSNTEITAYLAGPREDGPYPTVIFLHGCTGLERESYATPWRGLNEHAAWLNARGFVTLIVDSHGSRGITERAAWYASCIRGKGYLERQHDVYGAVDFLRGLPFVADDKIALIGMSQGGGVILITMDGKEAIGKIAAGIAFYPHCTFFGLTREYYVPILILIGSEDDITPVSGCQGVVNFATMMVGIHEGIVPPQIKIYPGVHHSFDLPIRGIQRTPIGTVASDTSARDDARERLLKFLQDTMGL